MASSEKKPAAPPQKIRPPAPPAEGEEEAPARKKKRISAEEILVELNMTPMIDCVFQLLIFFMTCTKFHTFEGKLLAYLPKDKGLKNVKIEEQKLPIRVSLTWNLATKQCKVYVGQKYTGIADQDGLQKAERGVKEIKATGTEKAEIDAQPNIPFRYVVQTLNMLIRARLKEISFAANAG